jgi:hypothetical protein
MQKRYLGKNAPAAPDCSQRYDRPAETHGDILSFCPVRDTADRQIELIQFAEERLELLSTAWYLPRSAEWAIMSSKDWRKIVPANEHCRDKPYHRRRRRSTPV